MALSITYAGGTVPAPTIALSGTQDPTRQASSVTHELMTGQLAFTLRQAKPAEFTIVLIYAAANQPAGTNYTTAKTALAALSLPTVYTYTNTDPALTLKFIVTGALRLQQAENGGDAYRLEIDAREVT